MRVNIEHVRKIQEERKKINSVPLEQIEWYKNGKKIDIDPKTIKEFQFMGLNNTDFIISNFYRYKGRVLPGSVSEEQELFTEKYKVLLDSPLLNGHPGWSQDEIPVGDSDKGFVPYYIDAADFVERIKYLRERGVTKAQCKSHMFKELEKKLDDEGMIRCWSEWNGLIEVAFGNFDIDSTNPVVRKAIERMKDKSL